MLLLSVRGLVFDKLVHLLLSLVGFRIATSGQNDARSGHSGLEYPIRGEWRSYFSLDREFSEWR